MGARGCNPGIRFGKLAGRHKADGYLSRKLLPNNACNTIVDTFFQSISILSEAFFKYTLTEYGTSKTILQMVLCVVFYVPVPLAGIDTPYPSPGIHYFVRTSPGRIS